MFKTLPTPVTEKERLLACLNAIQNNFMVGMAAVFLLENEQSWPMLEGGYVGFHPQSTEGTPENASLLLPVYAVGEAMPDPEIRKKLLFDFREFLFRNTLAEALEKTREYCQATGQEPLLNSTDWYNFARVIRNALTHNGIIRLDRYARPPLVFQKWRVDASDDGRNVKDLIGVPSTTAVPILQAIRNFVESTLK